MKPFITIVASIFVFGLVIFIHEFGHFITAKKSGVKVNEFSIGMGPLLFSRAKGDTQYSVRLLPIGGYCQMEGEDEDSDDEGSFTNASVWKRIAITVAGAVMNLILGFLILGILTATGGSIASRTVGKFYDDSATEASGLKINDKIIGINGSHVFVAEDIFYEMMYVEDGKADLEVIRDGERITLKDVRFKTNWDEENQINVIELDFAVYGVKKTVGTVIQSSFLQAVSTTRMIIKSVIQMITGTVPANSISGPVGIISVIGDAAGQGIRSLLNILSYISIDLGVMNLLPIPALDGGRLLTLFIEAVTKKKLSRKWEIAINIAGFVLLIGLMIFATYNDILRMIRK
ncbi:MAG: site-2 protease family protein [Oscillospiraceae bacterium]|nr:site-2 protease family protein [Oscillospiraceae bacterium]